MKVREALAADVPRVVALLQQLSRDDEVRESDPHDPAYAQAFAEIARDPRQRVLVVVDVDDRIVATGTLRITPNLSHKGRPIAHVESVVVDREARGVGVGALLMRDVEERAKAAGCFRVELTSNNARGDAHRFYERLGYAATHVGFKKKIG